MKRIEIGPWKDQTLWWVGNNDGLFISNGFERPPRARPDFPRYWRSSSDFGRRLGGNFHA
jgi:hypothetical protein